MHLDAAGHVRVLDFGLAALRGTRAGWLRPGRRGSWRPSSARDHQDERTDLWAAAAPALALLGARPDGEGRWPSPLALRPRLPRRMARALAACLADDRANDPLRPARWPPPCGRPGGGCPRSAWRRPSLRRAPPSSSPGRRARGGGRTRPAGGGAAV
ncbi:MAG: hypothetical protein R3F60_29475 [bacterium]